MFGGKENTNDRYYYHTQQPPLSRHTCTSHTRNPRKRHRSGSVAEQRSSYCSDRRLGSGIGWGGGLFGSSSA